MTIREVAGRLAIAPSTVYALVQSGKLVSHRIGVGRGAIRIDEQDLEAYLTTCRRGVRPARLAKSTTPRLKHLKV